MKWIKTPVKALVISIIALLAAFIIPWVTAGTHNIYIEFLSLAAPTLISVLSLLYATLSLQVKPESE